MIPCRNANCQEWIDPIRGDYCETCEPTPKQRTRKTTGYDALEVRGIGIVSPRRILVHRPKSVRRNTPVNVYTDTSYSDMRDIAELEKRRKSAPRDTSGKSVADINAERRTRLNNLLSIAGTLGENDRD